MRDNAEGDAVIFKQVDEIVAGTKTQTRRIVKPGERLWFLPWASDPRYIMGIDTPGNKDWQRPVVVQMRGEQKWRVKWSAGLAGLDDIDRTYAVVPGRGKPGILLAPNGRLIYDAKSELARLNEDCGIISDAEQDSLGAAQWLINFAEYKPLRIRITAIRRERVCDISEADAIAEGLCFNGYTNRYEYGASDEHGYYDPRDAYKALWDSINGKTKGARWQDNPACWCLTFEVVK